MGDKSHSRQLKNTALCQNEKSRPQSADTTDFMENFHDQKLYDIPATSPRKKKDALKSMRPGTGEFEDYDLSQTEAKLERQGPDGVQKVHIKNTTAVYKPHVSPKKLPKGTKVEPQVIRYTTGRGPCYEFLDDIWRRKIEMKQEKYRQRLQLMVKAKKKVRKEEMNGEHLKLINRVGPEWFQELSPKQLQTIDNLKNCIIKDIKQKSFCNTQDNMAELGIMMRPNHNHVKQALVKCCQCPVEFLLILYQLMNKNRTEYSLNDRLLLSGVVHLTMKETLKELHIRIPSPPPPPKTIKPSPVKVKRIYYESPYLVPYTFQPEPRKYTGIYKNKHVQLPESIYFSYKSELLPKKYLQLTIEEDDKESTPRNSDATSIIPNIKQEGITDTLEEELIAELRLAQQMYNKLSKRENVPYLNKPTIYIPCDYGRAESVVTQSGKKTPITPSSENQTNVSISVAVRVTTDFDECNRPIRKVCECDLQFDEETVPKKSCGCIDDAKDDEVIEGPCEFLPDCCVETKDECQTCEVLPDCCNETKEASVSTSYIQQTQTVDKRKLTKGQQCEDVKEELLAIGRRASDECKCKEENEKYLNKNYCQCDRCIADRLERDERRKNTSDSTKPNKVCTCLQEYQARIKMFEEIKKRFDAQRDLLTIKKQFIIGGVTYSPEGEPVYILSGTKPDLECGCAATFKDRMREKQRCDGMPKNLPTVPNYIIGGVRQTEDGSVYVIDGSEAPPDCSCTKTYNEYMKKHTACLQAYDTYLQKTQTDIKEYLNELKADERYYVAQTETTSQGVGNDCPLPYCTDKDRAEANISTQYENPDDVTAAVCNNQTDCSNKNTGVLPDVDGDCMHSCRTDEDNVKIETTLKLRLEINMDDAHKSFKTDATDNMVRDHGGDDALHRFVIMEKIPSKQSQHSKIIQEALEVLAKDGFPLAKLPDCYKLPHFRLWMQMRSGKYWTQKDRILYLESSTHSYNHTDHCSLRVWVPKIKPKLLKRKFTWNDYNTVKNLVGDMEGNYYRELRQARVYDGREFFSTCFDYEFPTYNFRDCYFSYTPGKENDCVAWKPWCEEDMRLDMRSSKPC